jgi:mitogen-activated protein kinase organizer 1
MSFPTTALTVLTNPGSTPSPINALTFSSGSGQYILTGSSDRNIRLWNPATSKLIQTYSAHGYEVLDLAVSSDNSKFVSVGGDKIVFIWDVSTAQTLRRFSGHAGRIESCALGGEGGDGGGESVVVTGSFDGTVKIWDLRSKSTQPIMTFNEARDAVSAVEVLGHRIYAGSVDGRVRVYDLASGMCETDVLGASVTSVTPTQDGEAYLASTLDSKLRLMDCKTGRCLQTFEDGRRVNETYRMRSCLAAADSVVLSGTEDGYVVVWDVLTGEVRARELHVEQRKVMGGMGKMDVVSAVAWNQSRKTWASAGADGRVLVWGSGYG